VQCLGRVIRSKTDYGIMILADQRYARADKRSKMPAWIRQYTAETHVNLSTDMAVTHAKEFLSKMSAPQKIEQQVGKILLSVDDIQGAGVSYAPARPLIGLPREGAASAAVDEASLQRAAKRAKGGNRAPQREGGTDKSQGREAAGAAAAGEPAGGAAGGAAKS
jgi:hypothetical protein